MPNSPPRVFSRAACLDLETTGLDRAKDSVVEVAVVLVDLAWGEIVASHATLLPADGNAAEHVNQIPAGLVRAMPPRGVLVGGGGAATLAERDALFGCGDWRWQPVVDLVRQADVVLAHRAALDHAFTPEGIRRLVPWACSKFGFPWRARGWRHGGHLTDLALAHGLTVTNNHRALADATLLARVLCEHLKRAQGSGLRAQGSDLTEGERFEFEAAVALGPSEPLRCGAPGDDGVDCGAWTFVERTTNDAFVGGTYLAKDARCPRHGGSKSWGWT